MKSFLLSLLFALIYADCENGCDLGNQTVVVNQSIYCDSDQYYFDEQCLSATCYDSVQQVSNSTSLGLFYDLKTDMNSISVMLNYRDQTNILSDGCVTYQIYQTKNTYLVDATRLGNNIATKFKYDNQLASIQFNITKDNLNKCLLFKVNDQSQWNCFFELGFQLNQNQTITSYYFSVNIQLDDTLDTSTLPNVEVVKLINVQQCQAGNSGCNVKISINSVLLFCSDQTCSVTSTSPFGILYVSKTFYVKHAIVDEAFQTYWIQSPQVSYQTYGFSMVVTTQDLNQIAHRPGYNIYALQIPIVASNVLISASGNLVPSYGSRVLLNLKSTSIINNQTNSGTIQAPNYHQCTQPTVQTSGVMILIGMIVYLMV